MAAVIALNPVSHGPGLAGRRELTSWGGYAHRLAEWEGRIPLVREPADIRILVAGGPGKHSSWCPAFGVTFSATRRIETR